MNVPEYTITGQILKNIASIEYAKALIENTVILPNWQTQLEVEAQAKTIAYSLQRYGLNTNYTEVKKYINNMPAKVSQEVKQYKIALEKVEEFAQNKDFDEQELKELNKLITGRATYRNAKLQNYPDPDEILAEIVKLFDWYHSLDAKETHPIITAAIFKARIELINPFDNTTSLVSDLMTILCFKSSGYLNKSLYSLEEFYLNSQKGYRAALNEAQQNQDHTKWLEYFTDGLNREMSNLAENIKILAKDTKLTKAAGRHRLTPRQERIVTYLQDFGMLQNKDFATIFPDISEDTVLRELKTLADKGIVEKRGKTKSSRYELS